jgi:peptidoglycan/xylan/chitin deacetylase (PgdA/CDA1 family)
MLSNEGYRAVTISQLLAIRRDVERVPERLVAITFDDGLHDFLTGAMGPLQRYSFPATLYVVSGYVGATSRWLASCGEGERRMLGWSELRDVAASGIECGAHTTTHPELDILSRRTAALEIGQSKRDLEDRLGCGVSTFAYPHGYASASTRRLVKDASFASACRVRHALSSPDEDPYALSRIIVSADTQVHALKSFLEGKGLPTAPPADRFGARPWRWTRAVRKLRASSLV